jgi:hypothetical protein
MFNKLALAGQFRVTHKKPKDFKRVNGLWVPTDFRIIDIQEFKNGITNEGKDHLLDSTFDAATQVTSWYIGLIDNAGFTALAAADTHASHGGWSESTAYDEAARPEWAPGAAASQSITNATARDFTIDTNSTVINGVFIASIATKGSTAAGTLWSTASFSAVRNVDDNDVLSIDYTVNA